MMQQQQQQPQQQHSRSYNSARLTIGDVVLISDPSEGIGVVRHIDELSFIIGIELTDPLGTSDGIRAGERYFKCRPKYGIFVSVSDIVRLVSPEELLHKIVVLNRALAHKHSTLSSKNKTIDKLKKEISSLTHTLQSYVMQLNELQQLQLDKNNDPLSLLDAPKKILSKELQQQIQNINTNKYHPKKPKYKHHKKLKYQQQPLSSQFNTIHSNNFNVRSLPRHNVVDVDDDGIDMLPAQPITEENSIEFDDIMDDIDNMNRNRNRHRNHNLNTNYTMLSTQKNQTSHRESKPQTPDQNTSSDESTDDEEEDDDDEDDTSDLSDEPHKKPRSRPPSRRGSFLNEYTHHLYDYPLNREVILHRGKQINDALYDYQQIKAKAKKKEPTLTHSNSHSHSHNRRKRKNKHSRDFSNEQLGFQSIHIPMSMPPMPVMPRSVSPISSHHSHSLSHHSNSSHSQSSQTQTQTQTHSHSHSKSKKRKSKHRKSNVEEAAKRLRKEIKAKSKQIMQQQQNMPIRPLPPKVSDDELLSDEYFAEISEKFNTSIGNTNNNVPVIPTQRLPKRFSRSQPTSPRRYENEFIFSTNHNALPHNANGVPYLPKLNTSLSHNTRKHGDGQYFMDGARSAAVRGTFDNITTNNNPYQFAANNRKPLKPTSIFRKNRDAFLKRMDERLQEAIHKFESKNGNANPTAPVASNGHNNITKFHSKPLMRKRGRSYNENSHEMQQMARENKAYTNANARGSHKKSSQSTNFRKQFEWMTTQTTFSKYHDKLALERQNKDSYDVDLVFNKQPSFAMKPRRSISLPSSPKHNKSLLARIDSLDLGDEAEQQQNEEDEDDDDDDEDEDDEEEEDVLEDVSDQSSMSDDGEEEEHDGMVEDDDLLVGDESDLYAHRHAGGGRKESQPMQYDSSKFLRRKRFLRRLKNKNRYTDPSTTTSSTSTSNNNTNSDPQMYDDDMDDMDDDMEIPQANMDEDEDEEEEEEEETYHRKTRVKQRRKLYQYKKDSDSDDINQGIVDSDNEDGQHGNNANMYDNDDVDEEEDGGKNEYIDFNQEQYNYYQNKKRNSKVHLLDKDEFEKEYNSILQ